MGIHLSTFKCIYRRYREAGSVALAKSQAGSPALVSSSGRESIKSYVETDPAMILSEIQVKYKKSYNIILSLASICHIL